MKTKHPGGRPTKLTHKMRKQLEAAYQLAGTDAKVAEIVGVTEQTINNWKKYSPKFFESLKDWKLGADGKVEKSLYQRALGYEHEEKHYPADITACIFWLKNRQPEKWRDKTEVDAGDNLSNILKRLHDKRG